MAASKVARMVQYVGDVRTEIKKVTWPSGNDLKQYTIAVIVVMSLIGVIIGLMDWMFSLVIIEFLGGIAG